MLGGAGWHALNYGAKPERSEVNRAKLARIVRYFLPHWRTASAILAVISLAAIAGVMPPLLLRGIVDQAIPRHDAKLLSWLAFGMVLLPLATGGLGVLETYLDEKMSQGIILDVRLQLFSRLQAQSMDYFTDTRPGEISSRLNNDVNDLGDIFSDTVVAITSNVLTLASTLLVIFTLNWRLALLAVAILPLFFPPAFFVGRLRQEVVTASQKARADLHAFVQDTMSINGFLMRRIFGSLSTERDRYERQSRLFADIAIRRSLIWRWFTLALGLFSFVGPAAIYWYGGLLAMGPERLSIGTIVAFVAYLGRLYAPTSALATVHVDVMSAVAVFDRIFAMLDAEPTVRDRPGAIELPPVKLLEPAGARDGLVIRDPGGELPAEAIRDPAPARDAELPPGHLVFENVCFGYRAERPLLEGISFEVWPGQLVALVGPSGAGKTTVTYLAARFYDPTGGRVLLDGHDLRDITLASLQARIGMVTQEPYLFHASLMENLIIARPDATRQEVIAACQAAYMHDAISALPEGYETVVGERGYRLSGGERQRLALARVILKGPPILILDEATSSLDSQSETLIQHAIAPLRAGRATLAIAHRLSTILDANLILVIDGGRIVERGTHAELLARRGLYARLYEEQFRVAAS